MANSGQDLCNDQRIAAHITTQLSRTMMTACLAMLAILGAVYTTLLPRLKLERFWFGVLVVSIIVSMILFILSIVFGGKAIAKVYSKLSTGEWSLAVTTGDYNRQA